MGAKSSLLPRHCTFLSLPPCHNTSLATPTTPKHFSFHSPHVKALFLPHQNTFLAIPATPKHFSCHSCHAKTLFLPNLPWQNAFIATPATPKHFSCHSRYAKTLFLSFLYHQNTSWSQLVTTCKHLVITWQHLVTTRQRLVTTWQHLATKSRQHSDQNCSLYIAVPPMKFKFPAFFRPNLNRLGWFRR